MLATEGCPNKTIYRSVTMSASWGLGRDQSKQPPPAGISETPPFDGAFSQRADAVVARGNFPTTPNSNLPARSRVQAGLLEVRQSTAAFFAERDSGWLTSPTARSKTMMFGEMSWSIGPQEPWLVGSTTTTGSNVYGELLRAANGVVYNVKNVRYAINRKKSRDEEGNLPAGQNPDDSKLRLRPTPETSLGSNHPGGAHVAMCDGSARFLSDNVGRRASSVANGQPRVGGYLRFRTLRLGPGTFGVVNLAMKANRESETVSAGRSARTISDCANVDLLWSSY